MRKLIIITASLLSLAACSLNKKEEIVYTNTAPNNIKIDLKVGWFDEEIGLIEVVNNDVYINTSKQDSYNKSYFAHLNNGNYEYYQKDVLNNGEWESFEPVVPNFDNMTTLDAINSFVGVIGSQYSDIFNVEVLNGVEPSGTASVLRIETSVFNVENRTFWYFEGINIFLKIYDESEQEWSCEVTEYQYYAHIDDSPNF